MRSSSRARRSYITIFFFIIIFIGTLFISYSLYINVSLANYFSSINKIQQETNSKMAPLNSILNFFQLEPSVAIQVIPTMKKTEKVLNKAVNNLRKIKPPVSARAYHRDLARLYVESGKISRDFYQLAGYIKARNKLFGRLEKAVKVFDSSVKEAKTDAQLIEAAINLRNSIKSILEELDKLSVPIKIYSSSQLKTTLDSIAQNLTTLEKAIKEKDIQSLQQTAAHLRENFSSDWSNMLKETDSQGIKKYQNRLKRLDDLKKKVDETKQAIE